MYKPEGSATCQLPPPDVITGQGSAAAGSCQLQGRKLILQREQRKGKQNVFIPVLTSVPLLFFPFSWAIQFPPPFPFLCLHSYYFFPSPLSISFIFSPLSCLSPLMFNPNRGLWNEWVCPFQKGCSAFQWSRAGPK